MENRREEANKDVSRCVSQTAIITTKWQNNHNKYYRAIIKLMNFAWNSFGERARCRVNIMNHIIGTSLLWKLLVFCYLQSTGCSSLCYIFGGTFLVPYRTACSVWPTRRAFIKLLQVRPQGCLFAYSYLMRISPRANKLLVINEMEKAAWHLLGTLRVWTVIFEIHI